MLGPAWLAFASLGGALPSPRRVRAHHLANLEIVPVHRSVTSKPFLYVLALLRFTKKSNIEQRPLFCRARSRGSLFTNELSTGGGGGGHDLSLIRLCSPRVLRSYGASDASSYAKRLLLLVGYSKQL